MYLLVSRTLIVPSASAEAATSRERRFQALGPKLDALNGHLKAAVHRNSQLPARKDVWGSPNGRTPGRRYFLMMPHEYVRAPEDSPALY